MEFTDAEGNKTGHLIGLLNKSLFMMKNGLKPIWVFDGKPPLLKSGELKRRKEIKLDAEKKMEEAKDAGDMEKAAKYHVRATRVDPKMKEDAMKMLRLLGFPVI
jgi:flap endonuclease-1